MRWALALAVLLLSGRALGQTSPAGLDLTWRPVDGCPPADLLESQVADAARGDEVRGRAEAVAARSADGTWIVEVTVDGDRRVLNGATCDEVAAAAAVVIAVALRRPPSDPVAPRPNVRVAPADELAVEGRAEVGAPWRVDGAASGGMEAGTFPDVAFVALLGAELSRGPGRLQVAAVYGTSTRSTDGETAYSTARMTRVSALLRGCLGGRVAACVGSEVGRMSASVANDEAQADGSGTWAAAFAGLGVAVWKHRSVELGFDADLVIPLAYPRFSVNGMESLGAPGGVGGRAAATLRLRFF